MALLRSLRTPMFATLFAGQTVSRVGDFLYNIALSWWVLQKTGSATAVGGVGIAGVAPMLLFLLIGGVAVDRLPRIRVMIASDIGRGIAVTLMTFLAISNLLEVWHVYLITLFFGITDAFFHPAYTATVPQITPKEDLTSANSLTSMSIQLARIAGPPIGAALIAVGGTSLAFGINAASFFISALFLLPLLPHDTPPERAVNPEQPPSILADVREGFSVVAQSPWLWVTIAILAFTNVTLAGPYSIALPFLVDQQWNQDVQVLGLLYATFPIGYLLGGLVFGRMATIPRRGVVAYLGIAAAGLGMLAMGLPLPLLVLLGAALINGFGLEAFGLIWTTTLQELVPQDKLGRVSSIDALGSFALLPIGLAITGWLVEQWGAASVCVLGGAVTIVLALLALLHPKIRGLE